MLVRAITWPKLIGVGIAVIGVGCLMHSIGSSLYPHGRLDHIDPITGVLFVLGLLLFLLSYPLYWARDWARRVLFFIFLLIWAAFVAVALAWVTGSDDRYDGYVLNKISHAGVLLAILGLLGVLTLALLHPDVVQAFQRRAALDDHQNI
jgi:uncharacterized membrane protein